MLYTFPGNDVLKEEPARSLCKTIFNAIVESIDKLNRDGRITRHTSLNRLFTLYKEKATVKSSLQ